MQFLSTYFGVLFGKLDTMTSDKNQFAHGKGDTQFMNLAFNINPVALVAAPYSPLDAGFIALPTEDLDAAVLNASASRSTAKASTASAGWRASCVRRDLGKSEVSEMADSTDTIHGIENGARPAVLTVPPKKEEKRAAASSRSTTHRKIRPKEARLAGCAPVFGRLQGAGEG